MRIGFFDPIGWDYDLETPNQRPLPGSQSALCFLSEELAKLGHSIFVFTHGKKSKRIREVQFCTFTELNSTYLISIGLDICIVLNASEYGATLRSFTGRDMLIVLWTQHGHFQPAMAGLHGQGHLIWDYFIFVSEWQKNEYLKFFKIASEKTRVLQNAMGSFFQSLIPLQARNLDSKMKTPTITYTSAPFLGLEILLKIFPEIKRSVPSVRLKVFSSMAIYRMSEENEIKKFGALYSKCLETEGVDLIGSIPQKTLAYELQNSVALVYPNLMPETSCISAIEAMAAGQVVISTHQGALPQTCAGFGHLIFGDANSNTYQEEFCKETIAMLLIFLNSRETFLEKFRIQEQLDFFHKNYLWSLRALQWQSVFTEMIILKRQDL